MAQYTYDETGALFSVFILTLLAILLLPTTYYTLASKSQDPIFITSDNDFPHCDAKRQYLSTVKRSSKSGLSVRIVLILLGWVSFALIAYHAATVKFDEPVLWDPYQILGVDSFTSEKAIKKAFKKLSLRFHPDKVVEDEKAEAEKKFVEISKAYKVLTDSEARMIFDETGHPDGKQAFQLGLALPKWLVEEGNSAVVLLFYTLIFGIGMPVMVARWWSKAKHMTKNKIENETMALFYRDIKESMSFKSLVDVLSKSTEFISLTVDGTAAEYEKLSGQIQTAMEETTVHRFDHLKKVTSKDFTAVASYRASLLIYAHLVRVFPEDPVLLEVQRRVIERCSILTNGMLQIVTARHWLSTTTAIIQLSQLIVQALYQHQSALMQIPYCDKNILKTFQTKNRNIDTVEKFVLLKKDEQRELLKDLSTTESNTFIAVADRIPAVKIVKANYSVLGEPAIIPGAIVTLSVKLRSVYGGVEAMVGSDGKPRDSEFTDPDVEAAKAKKWWKESKEIVHEPHAPYFFAVKKPTWWVIHANSKDNRVICFGKVVGLDDDKTVRLQFQAPPQAGTWTFQVIVKSDTYVGIDQKIDIKLIVLPESAAPIESDDNISEPEEESLAGQMQASKAQLKKRPKTKAAHLREEFDDSSDSDDESWSDGDRQDDEGRDWESDHSDFVE
ncbi:secretory subunit [Batrachochytrium dendrobatidis]|nr:secretory subunit [Batrachochytrium dendrobatidis]